jgi:hypothetical protein
MAQPHSPDSLDVFALPTPPPADEEQPLANVPPDMSAAGSAVTGAAVASARVTVRAALTAQDAAYANRAKRSRLLRPYRRLKRRIRHTPTRELVGGAVVLAIAVIGLAAVLAISLR